jgi:hypothetical protein
MSSSRPKAADGAIRQAAFGNRLNLTCVNLRRLTAGYRAASNPKRGMQVPAKQVGDGQCAGTFWFIFPPNGRSGR